MDPQLAWLKQIGLHPAERVDAVEDLEPLQLSGLDQFQLLDSHLEALLAGSVPDWCEVLAGQGVLPPGAGALLEQATLRGRVASLQRELERLGPSRRDGSRLFAGAIQVVVQPGRFNARLLMRGWLQHLQLCAADSAFEGTAVIARADRGDDACRHVQWKRLDPSQATAELEVLQHLALQGQHRCWPVPPDSGWLLMHREYIKPGSGEKAFRDRWIQERRKPQQQLCFGVEAAAEVFLDSSAFQPACERLYRPMLQALAS